jgi:hypothetical protein
VNKSKFEVKEMHKHNVNAIALQNSLYAHILKNSNIFSKKEDLKRIENIIKDLPVELFLKDSKELVISDDAINKISEYIRYKFGIYLTYDNVIKMLYELNADRTKLNEHLLLASEKINDSIKAVVENSNKADINPAEAETESEIIKEVINIPFVREVINRYLDSYLLKPLMNIETLSGEKIPVFKVATLTYNDVSLMRSHEKHFSERNYKNLFTNNKGSVLLGTGTKLEIIRDDKNIAASK